MREKLLQFMAGRNGNDELNRFLLTADLVLILLSVLFSRGIGRFLSPFALVLLGLTYYRMLSRDLMRRGDENARFLRLRERIFCSCRIFQIRRKLGELLRADRLGSAFQGVGMDLIILPVLPLIAILKIQ